MKISTNQKILLGATLFAPMVMFAGEIPTNIEAISGASTLISSTLKSSGKPLIYSIEGMYGAYTYFQTRSWSSLTGIAAVAAFTTILFNMI